MNPVVHFEMPYEDQSRVVAFYKDAFGWNLEIMGPEMGNYVVVRVTGAPDSAPDAPRGTIGGGFFKKTPENAHPSLVIGVPDIEAAMEKVKQCGGAVIASSLAAGKPMEIPGVGLYAGITDTEGNRLSLLQPAPRQ